MERMRFFFFAQFICNFFCFTFSVSFRVGDSIRWLSGTHQQDNGHFPCHSHSFTIESVFVRQCVVCACSLVHCSLVFCFRQTTTCIVDKKYIACVRCVLCCAVLCVLFQFNRAAFGSHQWCLIVCTSNICPSSIYTRHM